MQKVTLEDDLVDLLVPERLSEDHEVRFDGYN
jgi:hypothetical protein